MVSRRNFISITIIMLVLLFMFQATQVYYEYVAEPDVNNFIQETAIPGEKVWKQSELNLASSELSEQYVLFFGDQEGAVGRTVKQWCNYTKRNLVVCEKPGDFTGKIGKNQEYVLVESACLKFPSDIGTLKDFSEAGVSIVYCDLPDVRDVRKSTEFQDLLGIRKIQQENVSVTGIKLFSGFLLGGEVVYQAKDADDEKQDLTLEMPWYLLKAGAQTYMIGLMDEVAMDDEEITREMLPAILWSYSNGNSKVFVVNGDYLEDNTGVGILSAIDAKLNEYALYPILDAQLLTIANYPGLADENAAEMKQTFSGSMIQTGRDIVFPQLVATASQTNFTMSCMLQVQRDYDDANIPQASAYESYLRLMREAGAEMGISLDRMSEVTLADKLEADTDFLESIKSRYQFGAVYTAEDRLEDVCGDAALAEGVRTVVSAQKTAQDLIALGNENISVQTITGDASAHSYKADLYMRSVQTALGYTNVLLDMNKVFWPEENEDSWERLSRRFADNLYTYWRKYQAFEDVTVSQSDQKIRQLLTMDYSHLCKGKIIYLELEDADQPVSFIFRHQNMKPEYVSGGTCIALEDGTYLIRTNAQSVEIHLVDSYPIHNN